MAWIESHQELRDHPKTRRMARMLGINVAQVIGHLHMLWWWAMDYAPDGDLTDYDAYDIAEAAGWDGDPEALVDALLQCGPGASFGFLERTPDGRLLLHDWDDYNNEHKLRHAAAERKRRSRQRRAEGRGHTDVTGPSRDMDVTVTGRSRDGHAGVTLDRTGPDQTGQDLVKGEVDAASPVGDHPPLAPERVAAIWNDVCGDVLPRVTKLTDTRRRHVKARLAADRSRDEAWWRSYFARIRASPFCCGDNPRGWRADFDFAVRSEDVVARVLEGRYDGKPRAKDHGVSDWTGQKSGVVDMRAILRQRGGVP